MLTFQLFIDDDRYTVTTLRILAAPDDAQAQEMAAIVMRESPHHAGVELYCGDSRLFGMGSLGERGALPNRPRSANRRGGAGEN